MIILWYIFKINYFHKLKYKQSFNRNKAHFKYFFKILLLFESSIYKNFNKFIVFHSKIGFIAHRDFEIWALLLAFKIIEIKVRVADEFIFNCNKLCCYGCEKSKINVIMQIFLKYNIDKEVSVSKNFKSYYKENLKNIKDNQAYQEHINLLD